MWEVSDDLAGTFKAEVFIMVSPRVQGGAVTAIKKSLE